MSTEKITNLFSGFLALMPIIGIYASPIPGLNIAEICILLFWIAFIIKGKITVDKKFSSVLLGFVIYIILSLILVYFIKTASSDVLFRTIRFSLYYLTVVFWTEKYLNFELFWKWMRIVVYAAVVFIIIQYAFYYLQGRIVLGFIPGLKIYQDIYQMTDWVSKYSVYFRASAFFLEPAHLCQFFFLYLAYSLLNEKSVSLKDSFFASAGIILSTSGQGLVIGSIIWGIYLITSLFKEGRKVSRKRIVFTSLSSFAIIAIAIRVSQTAVFQNTVFRLLNTGEQSSSYARLNVYSYAFKDLPLFDLVFGKGFGSVPSESVFVPGLAYILYGAGIIGIVIISVLIIRAFSFGSVLGKTITMVFVILLVIASTFMSLIGILYLTTMKHECYTNNKKNSQVSEISGDVNYGN